MDEPVITDEILKQFKARMSIFHSSEDESLKLILAGSLNAIKRIVGNAEMSNISVKELVFERGRYAYNDQLEFFNDNFRDDLLGLSFDINEVSLDESATI